MPIMLFFSRHFNPNLTFDVFKQTNKQANKEITTE